MCDHRLTMYELLGGWILSQKMDLAQAAVLTAVKHERITVLAVGVKHLSDHDIVVACRHDIYARTF